MQSNRKECHIKGSKRSEILQGKGDVRQLWEKMLDHIIRMIWGLNLHRFRWDILINSYFTGNCTKWPSAWNRKRKLPTICAEGWKKSSFCFSCYKRLDVFSRGKTRFQVNTVFSSNWHLLEPCTHLELSLNIVVPVIAYGQLGKSDQGFKPLWKLCAQTVKCGKKPLLALGWAHGVIAMMQGRARDKRNKQERKKESTGISSPSFWQPVLF